MNNLSFMTETELLDFALLTLSIGVNLQKGQGLEVSCPVEQYQVARAFTKAGYIKGAKIVRIRWNDEEVDKINYINAETSVLSNIPKWFVQSKMDLVENDFCYVAIASENPTIFKDVDSHKLSLIAGAKSKALKKFSEVIMSNGIRWCVVSLPTLEWAKQVFPSSQTPLYDLSQTIKKTMRLDTPNPKAEWEKHIELLDKKANYLTDEQFEYLHFTNSLGTDLFVGLCDNYTFISAKELAKDGVPFVANMPTEEVFTAPHRLKTFGKVYSSMPLIYNGQKIDEFFLEFKLGKVVNFDAKVGYDTLKGLINLDAGTKRIGEVALIVKNSPIAKSGILFYNTLFDENASCHLALGKAYPTTVKNTEGLTSKQLLEKGLNNSIEHVDFMIGTSDLKIEGIKKDKEKVLIFKDGDFVI